MTFAWTAAASAEACCQNKTLKIQKRWGKWSKRKAFFFISVLDISISCCPVRNSLTGTWLNAFGKYGSSQYVPSCLFRLTKYFWTPNLQCQIKLTSLIHSCSWQIRSSGGFVVWFLVLCIRQLAKKEIDSNFVDLFKFCQNLPIALWGSVTVILGMHLPSESLGFRTVEEANETPVFLLCVFVLVI